MRARNLYIKWPVLNMSVKVCYCRSACRLYVSVQLFNTIQAIMRGQCWSKSLFDHHLSILTHICKLDLLIFRVRSKVWPAKCNKQLFIICRSVIQRFHWMRAACSIISYCTVLRGTVEILICIASRAQEFPGWSIVTQNLWMSAP